jgi:3-isopropylmalate/(R)-2-methylmalate dehydratase small subunit
MNITGTVIRYGDNVDTDVIIPARYLNSSDPKELAAHCMEDLDATFVTRVKPGDIMVGGNNFGCGSSREHAPIAIKESGIACVVAKSFARIFYRNSINTGLPIVEFDGDIDEGDQLEIDFAAGRIRNLSKNSEGNFPPFPAFLQKIIAKGGLFKAMEELV